MPYPPKWPSVTEFLDALRDSAFVEIRMEPLQRRVKGSSATEYAVLTRTTDGQSLSAVMYPLPERRDIDRNEMRSICRQLQVDVKDLGLGFDLGIPGWD